jgi:hypothetical protein
VHNLAEALRSMDVFNQDPHCSGTASGSSLPAIGGMTMPPKRAGVGPSASTIARRGQQAAPWDQM